MSRFPPTPREQLSAPQQEAYDELSSSSEKMFGNKFSFKNKDGGMVGPYPFLLEALGPGVDFLSLVQSLGKLPGLSVEARETTILAVGAHFQAGYEMYAHSAIAGQATKLSQEAISSICKGEKLKDLDEDCAAAYDVAKYLASKPGALPQVLWERSVKALGREGTVALVHYVGLYAYTCIVLNAMDAPVPKDGE
ncbi:hypothetical protein LTR78_007290 [Recurvomyces mirabilis]|uniref:Carboxymuconolactone decarboxylase-like domain-containing protein n=1 Tax=Recurvomyces mirabilis TaxID=574656 RepID=A0AAE0WJM6_9PEZI|nr:hypothetical protein LTR78_007290 [Recurvomyces mirabilis]KAK5155469.1 hypothetical protein LTS14_005730 [Recurvomyces mirabilis]